MRLVLVASMLVSCSGETPPNVDANPAGPRCSMQLYDSCGEEHDCASMICQNFSADGFQVCSQACGASLPCPADRSGSPAECFSGVCKPSLPNMCHFP